MALNRTGLVIVAAPLPPDFCGTLQEFYSAMVERFQILSPSGVAFFSQGSVLPSSDLGLFLLNGTQLFVWDANLGQYVPLDISASESHDFFVGPTAPPPPGPNDPVFWARTNGSRLVGIYAWTGTEWRASSNIDNSGPTAERPVAPTDLEHFWDTDINAELIFERGRWTTVSGSPGDTKFVTQTTLAEALRFNPGWEFFNLGDEASRGRVLSQASRDVGGSPVDSFTTSSGITPRAPGDLSGEELHVLNSAEHEKHVHSVGIFSPTGADSIRFHRADNGAVLATPAPVPPNYVNLAGTSRNSVNGVSGSGGAGEGLITSGQFLRTVQPSLTDIATGHNTIQPTLSLYCLTKL